SFSCQDKTALGSLENMYGDKADLILTNPPFVVSGSADIKKIINRNNKRKRYFSQKASGVEGLFIQFIVHALKPRGDAWVLLPESFFLRTTDRTIRQWLHHNCEIRFLAVLPERAFYNTPKRVVIMSLKKRSRPLTPQEWQVSVERTLVYAVSEIGETR